jgi:hypothetical protein
MSTVETASRWARRPTLSSSQPMGRGACLPMGASITTSPPSIRGSTARESQREEALPAVCVARAICLHLSIGSSPERYLSASIYGFLA